MKIIDIKAGPYCFEGRLEEALAPDTLELLPYTNRVIHSRWSGEAVWIPLGEFDMRLDFENHT